ncbi:MAG: ABC transporter substrate-binding protein, partial [Kamptonema sp. SIO4C4]|nr:ABC transporter substrate-binding protein [Kamptonema sp. SIO4C4]
MQFSGFGWIGKRLIIALILGVTLLLNGCQGLLKSQATPVSQLVFVSPSDPATFNAPLNTSTYSVFGFINEGLVTQNGITAELEPALAESWEISDDNLQIVFTLREGLQWSDGEPLTADDVVFSYNSIYLNEKVPTGIRDILRVGDSYPSVRKIDDRHVEFTVPQPFAPFLRYAGGISILPKHALQKSVETTDEEGNLRFLSKWSTDTDPRNVVGAGPYRMVSYTPSQRVIFERNPYYWREDEQGNQQPYIKRVILQIIESDEAQSIAFRSGQLDSLDVTPDAFRLLKQEEDRGNYTIYNGGPGLESRFLGFNLNQARNAEGEPFVDPIKSRWFNTLAFRQAVAYAVNRERMKNNIYRGLGVIQDSPFNVSSPYYRSAEEGLTVYRYNPEKAQELLQDAGFQYNEEGILLDADSHPHR